MRHDAHRFIRRDWRRFVAPRSEAAALFERYERKYRPDQLRDEIGRWADEGGENNRSRGSTRAETVEFSAASKGRGGHHEVPRAVFNKLNLPEETRKVLDDATTGPVPTRGHKWDDAHRKYNDAVNDLTKDFMAKNNIEPEKMTPDQARALLEEVRTSSNPRISDYNKGIRMMQFMYRLRGTGGRGNE